MSGRVPSTETSNTDGETKVPGAAIIGGLGFLLFGLMAVKASGHHSTAPNAGEAHGAQSSHSISGPATSEHTPKTTAPKATTANHQQKPVTPVNIPNILDKSWSPEAVPAGVSSELVELNAENKRKAFTLPVGKTSVLFTVDAPGTPSMGVNVTIDDIGHDGSNTATFNDGEKIQVIPLGGQTKETVLYSGLNGDQLDLDTSATDPQAIGFAWVPAQ